MDAPPADEAKAVVRADFFSPNGKQFYRLDSAPSSESEIVTAQTAYAAAIYAYAAMRWRAEKYSEPPLMIVEETDDGDEWLPDHELAGLLDMPSPDFDMGELLRISRLYRDTTGSCIWLKDSARNGQVGRLTPFSGDEFKVKPAGDRIYGRFEIQTSTGTIVRGPDDVVYFRETSPYRWDAGLAPLHVCLGMLNLGARATATVREILKNALFPSVIVQTSEKWAPSEDDFARFKAMILDYAQIERKGEPFVLTGGGSATVVSQTLQSLMPSEILNRVEAATASAFGVPAVVLGFLSGMENSPWSQMSEARRMAYEDTLEPMWRRDGSTMTRQLLRAPTATGGRPIDPESSHYVRYDTSTIRALQEDRKQQAEIAQITQAFWTVDELRVFTGMEPFGDERGEVVPGLRPPANPFAGMFGEPAPEKRQPAGPQAKAITRATHWKLWDAYIRGQEFAWQLAAAEALEKNQADVLALARATLREGKAAEGAIETKGPPFGADPESIRALIRALAEKLDLEKAWQQPAKRLTTGIARRGTESIATQVGVAFDLLAPGLTDYVEKHAARLVTAISDTTRNEVAGALRAGLEAGESVPDLTKRLQELGAFGKARAELIARTEVTTVSNNAGVASLKAWAAESGSKVFKAWLATPDDRTRDEHVALDGEEQPIGKAFSNGLQAPGEPNCRCTLTYRIAEEA